MNGTTWETPCYCHWKSIESKDENIWFFSPPQGACLPFSEIWKWGLLCASSVTLSKHVTHYRPHKGCLYYKMTTPPIERASCIRHSLSRPVEYGIFRRLVFCARALSPEQIKGSKDYIRQLFVYNSFYLQRSSTTVAHIQTRWHWRFFNS